MSPNCCDQSLRCHLTAELSRLGLNGTALTRREALRLGLLGAAGTLMTTGSSRAAEPAPSPMAVRRSAKAKSVIQIWLWGGPCHLDTFDPKPDAGYDYAGPLRAPIATRVAEIGRAHV